LIGVKWIINRIIAAGIASTRIKTSSLKAYKWIAIYEGKVDGKYEPVELSKQKKIMIGRTITPESMRHFSFNNGSDSSTEHFY
jgi:hypothetical protein